MGKAEQQTTARRRAVMYRDGLIIAFLALRPLRRRNLARLDLGRTLVRRAEAWWIEIPPEDTKTRVPIEENWPAILIDPLERYLVEHRGLLSKAQGRWSVPVGAALWVSSDGSPMTEMAIYDRVRERTRDAYGKSVNPHLFRDAAATTLAIEAPADVHLAAPLLGHRSLSVTERHYQQARSLEAHRAYAEVLAARRDRRSERSVSV